MVIVKHLDDAGTIWSAYYGDNTNYIRVHATSAAADAALAWNDTSPTATLFSFGAGYGGDSSVSDTMIAYCFHSVEGYSKVGSYMGNGLAVGSFVYLGFRPAWVMIKGLDSVTHWQIHDSVRDTYNVMDNQLHANESAVDATSSAYYIDFLANGFILRMTHAGQNANGSPFLYLAFAETPLKYANAR